MPTFKSFLLLICLTLFAKIITAQQKARDTANVKIIPAGKEYKRSSFYQWLWGKNHREAWYTPVKVDFLDMDTAYGGLKVAKVGGGNQSKSLQLKNPRDKEYALRSVNKSLSLLVPPEFHGTFIEKMANDQISMSHPYAALAIPVMAEKAGINHMEPRYYYVPRQPALDTLNKKYGDATYLFEQRPSGNWSDAPNLGRFNRFINSEDLLEKLQETNERQIDQPAFARARLFDMLIGDWDRHFDQWKWGFADEPGKLLYVPIPTDRDQAFVKFDGIIQKALLKNMPYMKNFDHKISNVKTYGYERRNLDRYFTNELTSKHWEKIADELKNVLTDEVITSSVRKLPPEIFSISGNVIIEKLKSRRNQLGEYALEYYQFLASEPEIVGSRINDYFSIKQINDNETSVEVFRLINNVREEKPYYFRLFNANETREIRLFGVSGNDVYIIDGKGNTIPVRIIAGPMKDSIINNTGSKIHLYDDKENHSDLKGIKWHIVKDSAGHAFDYDAFRYNVKGLKLSTFFNDEDRLFVGAGYNFLKHTWRKRPFASKQGLNLRYSISQKAFSVNYDGLYPSAVGKSDLVFKGYYDAIRWLNFYGLGNETKSVTKHINFYRMQTEEWFASAGLRRVVGKKNIFQLGGFFHSVRVINDENRFLSKDLVNIVPGVFERNEFIGARFNYLFADINNVIIPTKGIVFGASAGHAQNIGKGNSFQKYSANLKIYIPLVAGFSVALNNGLATVIGKPEFYQYVSIGETDNLRGFRRERFWGKTAFFNSNELRFIQNVRSCVYNGKIGILGFFDDGRVWVPGENAKSWHNTYGGGIILVPFNKLAAQVTYGISDENKLIQLRITTGL